MRRFGGVLLVFSLLAACTDDVAPASSVNNRPDNNTTNGSNNDTNNGSNNDTNNGSNNGSNNDGTCDGNEDCTAPEVCLIDGTGVGICGIDEAEPCLSNTQCVGSDVCVVDRSGDALNLDCSVPVGGGDLGQTCTTDADCASNLCHNGACTEPCERPADCAADGSYACESVTVPMGNGSMANLNACQPRPQDACLSDAQCAGGERCVATRSATDIDFACGNANAGGGESGAACTTDADCAQNLCVNDLCAGPCQANGDCAGAADFSCELTPVDLGNNVTDNAQICVPPVACTQDDDCKTTEVCYVRPTDTGVDTFCRAKNVGGGTLGQVCSGVQECANNYCLDTRFRDVCAIPCADSTDCTRSGYVCQDVDVDYSNGSETVKMCVPGTPAACSSNDDCPTATDCAIIPNVTGDALESVCVPSTGGDATGVACTDDTDCASLLCLNGFCAAPCDDSTQCSTNQLCQSTSVTQGTASGTFDVCQSLSDALCDESGDCTDGVRVCSDIRLAAANLYETYCEFPNTNATALMGEPCATPNECRDNVCLSPAGACSVVCNSDDDCAPGMGCSTYTLSSMGVPTSIGFCIDLCADNGDCSNGNLCTINGDVINDDVDQVCEKPVGTKDLGELCASGNECNTGLCLRTLNYSTTACTDDSQCATGESCSCPIDNPNCAVADKRCATQEFACTRLCNDNTDCAGGAVGNELTECSQDTRVTRPVSMTSKTISTCSRP